MILHKSKNCLKCKHMKDCKLSPEGCTNYERKDKRTERSTNALAELAETMNTPVEHAPVNARGLIVLNGKQLEAYQKAQRIVAELAKVKFGEDGLHENDFDVDGVLSNCRAIAEEGAKNGK